MTSKFQTCSPIPAGIGQFASALSSRTRGESWIGLVSAGCLPEKQKKSEPVFGSTLSVICQNENSLVPKFIRVVTEVIESKGLKTDGIYRVSGNLSAVQKIRCQADQDNYKALVAEEDIHVLTGALKLFFRELSEPLFPVNLHKEYTSAMQVPNTTSRFKKFEELLSRLPQENRESLKLLLGHLNRVAAHSSQNRMQQHNLAIVFGPTLFHNGDVASSYIAKNKKSTKKKGLKKVWSFY
uniref:Rho-GAP domain-containing protein n=1 Tax=Caenorhabditis japonica TaxID=281687 RepID=A0A8R1IBF1_CAEJA